MPLYDDDDQFPLSDPPFHSTPLPGAERTVKSLFSTNATSSWLREAVKEKHILQLGTLGGGNHFIELVYDENGVRGDDVMRCDVM